MTIPRFIAIGFILFTATVAWMIQSAVISSRSTISVKKLNSEVRQVWGAGFVQPHLSVISDAGTELSFVQITSSQVEVDLKYKPQRRGLLWHRTYDATLKGSYSITNHYANSQNVRVRLTLPSQGTSYDNFSFQLGDSPPNALTPNNGTMEAVTMLPAGATVILKTGYTARGMDSWAYVFQPNTRLTNFSLKMHADFEDISFPAMTSSPTARTPVDGGWNLEWAYTDVIDVRDIGMDMPKVLNSGPVVARITFFAPLSLALFFAVLVVIGMLKEVNLHPMIYAFLAAGYFSFHLLLAYLCDIMSLHVAFLLAAIVSMLMVSGYLHIIVGKRLSIPASAAQFVYLILFSYSFFFDGLTGLTLTIIGITSLAILMYVTARVNWENVLSLTWKKDAPKKPASETPAIPVTDPQVASV